MVFTLALIISRVDDLRMMVFGAAMPVARQNRFLSKFWTTPNPTAPRGSNATLIQSFNIIWDNPPPGAVG
ncbi:MAG: hypothetical protein OXC91_06675, partial [Rhodobacteraceae bacterium]|nr:hypothetical protein [Paracoccaceae bacterium]